MKGDPSDRSGRVDGLAQRAQTDAALSEARDDLELVDHDAVAAACVGE
jgi:hypothetical protein